MKILYIAAAITLSDRSGGATHVREVAEGLARRGHEVHVVARGAGEPSSPRRHGGTENENNTNLRASVSPWLNPVYHSTPMPDKLAVLALPQVMSIARAIGADVVMERYYNFAGAGALLARQARLPYVLEVNAPMVDPAGSLKSRLDGLTLGSMRRWAVAQARQAQRIVTPLASTVPPEVQRDHIVELPWGANVARFNPQIRAQFGPALTRLRSRLGIPQEATVAVFAGSFRSWHGVQTFAEAAKRLSSTHPDLYFLAIGGGPERHKVKDALRGSGAHFVFTGPQQHERMPALLALADIGVAPFEPDTYPPLREFGFYWSPLKVFEYMASGLPVVTIDIPPLNRIVREGHEGLLYPPGDVTALAHAIGRLAGDAALRDTLGQTARQRVVEHYSWAEHCRHLETVLADAIRERG